MEGKSPVQGSVESGPKRSSVSSGSRHRSRKEFLRKFVDSDILTADLEDWFSALSERSSRGRPVFDVLFELKDLQMFDYALENVSFQQLIRMPTAVNASTSDSVVETAYLALEDFLYASVKGLWELFWTEESSPFYVSSVHNESFKLCHAEKAIASGKLGGLCASTIMLKDERHSHREKDVILEFALLRPEIRSLKVENDRKPSFSALGDALFFALRMLLTRSVSRLNVQHCPNCVFVLLVDTQLGGVVRVEGDLDKLEFEGDVYQCGAKWIIEHSHIAVSSIDRIWNKLGNPNWGDIGARQALLATFHCIAQVTGMPRRSIDDLAADRSSLQLRRIERQLGNNTSRVHENGLYRYQQSSVCPEIVELHDESKEVMELEVGSILWLDESNLQKGFQINEVLCNGHFPFYSVTPVEEPRKSLFMYVGSHPSQLEPALEDMTLWYQVQRQTKILTAMKQSGITSKYLPQLVASGRIVHPGQCQRPSSGANCDHPWCGTSVLVMGPVGKLVAELVRDGNFGPDKALKCCHDCLSALSTATSAGIRHGDIRPENVICVSSGVRNPYYVLIGWGHAILEERDRPTMNLHFSSTYALQEGKLCSASDAESLIYLLFFSSGGGILPELDSVEGALQWREASWSKRLIQQTLGEISAVLKAFADYVDSLCGTPYSMDYEIWLRRMRTNIHEDHRGKEIGPSG